MTEDSKTGKTRRFSTLQLSVLMVCFLFAAMAVQIICREHIEWCITLIASAFYGFVIITMEADYFLGLLYEKQGKLEKSIEAYSRQISISKNRVDTEPSWFKRLPVLNLGKCYANRADIYEKLGDLELAQQDRDMALKFSNPQA